MKIICAPDNFKESLSAYEAAEAMGRGIRSVKPDAHIDLCPIADGGDGTVDAMLAATEGQEQLALVAGPLGSPIQAAWGILGGGETAVIEMATASGLAILETSRRDPTKTSTFGTGQLVQAALDAGVKRIIVGIGGSATTDGGCGVAQALGVRFIDQDGQLISAPMCGEFLEKVAQIDMTKFDPRIAETTIVAACDVTNPLTGENGAAAIYGPQKGATPQQVAELDRGLTHLAALWKQQLGSDIAQMPGAGAAGGLGAGLVAFLGATLQPGVQLVLDAVGFADRISNCDLCLTGEGRLDGQSLSGKACLGVAAAAGKNVRTIALVGSLGAGAERTLDAGLSAYHLIGSGLPQEESMRRAAELLEQTTATVVRSVID